MQDIEACLLFDTGLRYNDDITCTAFFASTCSVYSKVLLGCLVMKLHFFRYMQRVDAVTFALPQHP